MSVLLASAAAQPTCGDVVAAGVTTPCVQPIAFNASAAVSGYPLPAEWRGPAPVCYAQYINNQLGTPTFMPSDSWCALVVTATGTRPRLKLHF